LEPLTHLIGFSLKEQFSIENDHNYFYLLETVIDCSLFMDLLDFRGNMRFGEESIALNKKLGYERFTLRFCSVDIQ
jgi:hypothetical protein